MNKKIALALIMSLFLASTTASEAGAVGKAFGRIWHGIKKAPSTAANAVKETGKLAHSISMVVIAGATIRELQTMPVAPEIQQAKDNGNSTYQTRLCDSPDGLIEVPQETIHCPFDDKTPVDGPIINFKN